MPREAEHRSVPWEEREVAAAAREAAAIGGWAGDEGMDPAQRPLAEAGEGVAEGFELAEDELVQAAEHRAVRVDPLTGGFAPEPAGSQAIGVYGEADHEDSSEVTGSDR